MPTAQNTPLQVTDDTIATLAVDRDLGFVLRLRAGDVDLPGTPEQPLVWEGPDFASEMVELLNEVSNPPVYEYGPSDGAFGHEAAVRARDMIGGDLTFYDSRATTDDDEERVY